MFATASIGELHPIFMDCCTKKPSRYDLSKPFRIGHYVYATTGSIVVRAKLPLVPIQPRTDAPEAARLPWDATEYMPQVALRTSTGPIAPMNERYGICAELVGLLMRHGIRAVRPHPMSGQAYFVTPEFEGLVGLCDPPTGVPGRDANRQRP